MSGSGVSKNNMPPKVAVLYLTYNTPASATDIPDCFRSLEQVDYPKDRWRIIVVENPSKHGKSYPFIMSDWMPKMGQTLPEIDIHPNAVDKGFAGANVVGSQAAKAWGADYIYLLNQDATADSQFLSRIVAEAEAHPNAAVIQSRIMLKQAPELLNARGNALHYLGFGFSLGYRQTPEDAKKNTLPMFYASGAGVLIRMSAIEKIGLFEPSYYMYHEDVDVSWRARLAGYDVLYAEDSVIYHHYEFSKSIKKFYWMERNRHLTNLTNYKIGTLIAITPMLLVMELGAIVFAIKGGWLKEKARSWLHFLKPSTWLFVLRRRKEVKAFRRASDRAMLEYMVGVIENQEVESPLTKHVVNPILNLYFKFLKALVRW